MPGGWTVLEKGLGTRAHQVDVLSQVSCQLAIIAITANALTSPPILIQNVQVRAFFAHFYHKPPSIYPNAIALCASVYQRPRFLLRCHRASTKRAARRCEDFQEENFGILTYELVSSILLERRELTYKYIFWRSSACCYERGSVSSVRRYEQEISYQTKPAPKIFAASLVASISPNIATADSFS